MKSCHHDQTTQIFIVETRSSFWFCFFLFFFSLQEAITGKQGICTLKVCCAGAEGGGPACRIISQASFSSARYLLPSPLASRDCHSKTDICSSSFCCCQRGARFLTGWLFPDWEHKLHLKRCWKRQDHQRRVWETSHLWLRLKWAHVFLYYGRFGKPKV